MIVDEFFEKQYLVAGNTYDNFVFENCPNELLSLAQQKLSRNEGTVKPCVACIDRPLEEKVELTINNCAENFQKKILARDFATALVVKELLQYLDNNHELKDFIDLQIKSFLHNDFKKVKELHGECLMPHDVKKIANIIGKIELDFILEDTKNKYLQQAINVFVSSREPYSVKIFTNSDKLPSYYDLNGNIIECPHDFMRRDVNKFIMGKD